MLGVLPSGTVSHLQCLSRTRQRLAVLLYRLDKCDRYKTERVMAAQKQEPVCPSSCASAGTQRGYRPLILSLAQHIAGCTHAAHPARQPAHREGSGAVKMCGKRVVQDRRASCPLPLGRCAAKMSTMAQVCSVTNPYQSLGPLPYPPAVPANGAPAAHITWVARALPGRGPLWAVGVVVPADPIVGLRLLRRQGAKGRHMDLSVQNRGRGQSCRGRR